MASPETNADQISETTLYVREAKSPYLAGIDPTSPETTDKQRTLAPGDKVGSPLGRCCWNCGARCVDWERTHALNMDDIDYILSSLQYELIRHEFWCKDIDPWAVNSARRRGRRLMPEYAEKRIRNSVGNAHPYHDGFQTKGARDVLFYAQHATATCCRSCIEIWYGIPKGRELTDAEVKFCSDLLLRYVDARMPDLNEEPEKVPGIRKSQDNESR